MVSIEEQKHGVALAALDLVVRGMVVGLGSGSTAEVFISLLARRCSGYRLRCLASSRRSFALAKSLGLELVEWESATDEIAVDLCVDGADAIWIPPQESKESNSCLVKGAGGCMVRERVLSVRARRFVVIVDARKEVSSLHGATVPIEVLPYGVASTLAFLRGFPELDAVELRCEPETGAFFVSDNGHYIADARLSARLEALPQALSARLDSLPGVIGHGLFLNAADDVFVGSGAGVKTLRVART